MISNTWHGIGILNMAMKCSTITIMNMTTEKFSLYYAIGILSVHVIYTLHHGIFMQSERNNHAA